MLLLLLCLAFSAELAISDVDAIISMDPLTARDSLNKKSISVSDFGVDLASKYQRSNEADAFLYNQSLIAQGEEKEKILASRAWVLYSLGKMDEALEQLDSLLVTTSNSLIVARSKYLIGLIHFVWVDLPTAESNLSESLSIYKSLGRKGGQNNCLFALSKVRNELGGSEVFSPLQGTKDKEDFDAGNSLWSAYESMKTADYDSAIAHALFARQYYISKSETLLENWANAILAICYTITGSDLDSLRYTSLLSSFCKEGSYERLAQYHLLAVMLRRKCKGYNYSSVEKKIQKFTEENNAPDIFGLLQVTYRLDCNKR